MEKSGWVQLYDPHRSELPRNLRSKNTCPRFSTACHYPSNTSQFSRVLLFATPWICSIVSNSLWPHGLQPARLLCPWDSPGKNTGVGCHALLQGNFPTQGSNPGLLHCRWILHWLSHQGSPIFWDKVKVLQEGGPLPRPETGLLSNTQKWIVRGDTCADKVRDFIGKGHPGGLSLANHSDSESFLVVHALFSQDGCQREGFWEVVRHVVSPFDLSWTLPVGGSLLVLCSLPRPLVVKQFMQMVTMVPGQGGLFQSVCFP